MVKPHESKERERSRKIDQILTGKYTAIPSFIGIMALVFWLTFNVIGAWLQGLLGQFIGWLTELADAGMTAWNVNDALHSLIINGIFNGVGSVLSFLPIIVTLFFFLSLLEDTGYMARVAFVMDKLLRKIGLSGRSIVPMLIGFGCSGTGVMAARTCRRNVTEDDDHADSVYELYCKTADLRIFYGGIFSGVQRIDYGCTLFWRYCSRYSGGDDCEEQYFQRGCGTFCYGAAEL